MDRSAYKALLNRVRMKGVKIRSKFHESDGYYILNDCLGEE